MTIVRRGLWQTGRMQRNVVTAGERGSADGAATDGRAAR